MQDRQQEPDPLIVALQAPVEFFDLFLDLGKSALHPLDLRQRCLHKRIERAVGLSW